MPDMVSVWPESNDHAALRLHYATVGVAPPIRSVRAAACFPFCQQTARNFYDCETHLRKTLSAYVAHYNHARPHLALQKDAPLKRAVQSDGSIVAIPVLAGLHHQYVRI